MPVTSDAHAARSVRIAPEFCPDEPAARSLVRWLVIAPVLKTIARGHGYAIFKTFLEKSQWWSADQRDAWITGQLKHTLVSALAVPFYRDAFAALGFDPRTDFADIRDLARLPILTRQQVKVQRDRLYARRSWRTSMSAHTSGTTGEPLAMRLAESFIAFDSACVFRHWSWAGYELRQPIVALRSYVPETPSQDLWRYSRAQNTMYFSAYHLTPHNCELYIDRVVKFRPRIIRGYPSTMTLFAEYAYRRRAQLSFVAGIFTSSETLLDAEREIIERTFGNKVFNWYGMTEPALVLTECEARRGMHVNWEYGHGEFLRSDDLAPDEFRLVTTGYHNPVMPLIRYDTGDVVRLRDLDRRCECGRTMPLCIRWQDARTKAFTRPTAAGCLPSISTRCFARTTKCFASRSHSMVSARSSFASRPERMAGSTSRLSPVFAAHCA